MVDSGLWSSSSSSESSDSDSVSDSEDEDAFSDCFGDESLGSGPVAGLFGSLDSTTERVMCSSGSFPLFDMIELCGGSF